MSDPKHQTTFLNVPLVGRLEAAARRWWMPAWLSDLLIQASAEIEVRAEMEKLLRYRLDIARGDANG